MSILENMEVKNMYLIFFLLSIYKFMYILKLILEIMHLKLMPQPRDFIHSANKTIPAIRLTKVYSITKHIGFITALFSYKRLFVSAYYMFAKNISKPKPCLVINYLRKIRHNQGSILKNLSNLSKNLMCFYNVLYGKRRIFKN